MAPPRPANAANYTRLSFHDDFTSTASIDLSGTGKAGYKWYTDRPFSWGRTSADSITIKDSVLTLNAKTESPNYGIGTSSPKTKQGKGFRFGYFEARLAFDPKHSLTSKGWPSFWGLSRDHIIGTTSRRSAELDFFEAHHEPGKAFGNMFVGSLHDALLDPKYTDRGNYGSNTHPLPNVDWNSWHTYGCLWQPGKVTWYFDGRPVVTQAYSPTGFPVPNTSNHPKGIFSNLDAEPMGQSIILGSGVGYPLKVDWVRIWQAR